MSALLLRKAIHGCERYCLCLAANRQKQLIQQNSCIMSTPVVLHHFIKKQDLNVMFYPDNTFGGHRSMNRQWRRQFRTTTTLLKRDKALEKEVKEKQLIVRAGNVFDAVEQKERNRATYVAAVNTYHKKEGVYRRGHVAFIYAAMDKMSEFSVQKDLSVYKELLHIFPKGKMIPESVWQVEFFHYPKQQSCALDLMDKMEENGVVPDKEFGDILNKIFGQRVHAFRKYRRMLYWLPKFKNINPYMIPYHLPTDPAELALLVLRRMSVDLETTLTVYQSSDVEENPFEDTFIASALSPKQLELIEKHPTNTPIYVDGGYNVWARETVMKYFVLLADPDAKRLALYECWKKEQEDDDNLLSGPMFYEAESTVVKVPSAHEQNDGTILAMCITGTSSKASVVSWIRCLQKLCPKLQQIPVVFRLKSQEAGIMVEEGETQASEGMS